MKLKKLKLSEQQRLQPAPPETSATDLSSGRSSPSPGRPYIDLDAKFSKKVVNQGQQKRDTKKKLNQIFRTSFGAAINLGNLKKQVGDAGKPGDYKSSYTLK